MRVSVIKLKCQEWGCGQSSLSLSYTKENKMIFPCCICGELTKKTITLEIGDSDRKLTKKDRGIVFGVVIHVCLNHKKNVINDLCELPLKLQNQSGHFRCKENEK